MLLSKKLRNIRMERNLSQPEMAEILDVSQSTYCDWESSRTMPNTKNLFRICKELDLNIYDLLEEKTINKVEGNIENIIGGIGVGNNNTIYNTNENIVEQINHIIEENKSLKEENKLLKVRLQGKQ